CPFDTIPQTVRPVFWPDSKPRAGHRYRLIRGLVLNVVLVWLKFAGRITQCLREIVDGDLLAEQRENFGHAPFPSVRSDPLATIATLRTRAPRVVARYRHQLGSSGDRRWTERTTQFE